MSQHRTWDDSRSPQWKYFLQRESAKKRKTRRELDKEREITREEEYSVNPPTKIREKKEKKKRFFSRIEGELKEKLQKQNTD